MSVNSPVSLLLSLLLSPLVGSTARLFLLLLLELCPPFFTFFPLSLLFHDADIQKTHDKLPARL